MHFFRYRDKFLLGLTELYKIEENQEMQDEPKRFFAEAAGKAAMDRDVIECFSMRTMLRPTRPPPHSDVCGD